MNEQVPAIKKIRIAAKRRREADEMKREATEQLRDYCDEARKQGVSITQIAAEAGLSRQGVYDLLPEQPSPS